MLSVHSEGLFRLVCQEEGARNQRVQNELIIACMRVSELDFRGNLCQEHVEYVFLLEVYLGTALLASYFLSDMDRHFVSILADQNMVDVVHAHVVAAHSFAELHEHVVELQDDSHDDVLAEDLVPQVDCHDVLVVLEFDAVLHLFGDQVRVVHLEGDQIVLVCSGLVGSEAVEVLFFTIYFGLGDWLAVQTEFAELLLLFFLSSYSLQIHLGPILGFCFSN